MSDVISDPVLTYGQQVWRHTVARWGARLGLTWIAVIAALATLAPFLANSHPLLLHTADGWSSPALRHLNPADVVMLGGAVTALALFFYRGPAAKWLILLWVVAALIPLSAWKPTAAAWQYEYARTGRILTALVGLILLTFIILLPFKAPRRPWLLAAAVMIVVALLLILRPINPPQTVVYQQYRELESAGQVRFILRAPIPYSPTDRLRDQSGMAWRPPSVAHPMGTERNSQDVFSRMIHASRIALFIGFIATGIALVIGIIIGGLMGYWSGRVDILGMRLIEIFDAIPTLFLLIAFVAFFGRNLYMMMVLIGLTSWSGYARFIRAEFLKLRGQDFVQAAIAAGLPLRSVLFRHMLPNGIAPVLVSASFGVASAILAESTLSFLGLGLVEEPSWGEMLNQAVGEGAGFLWWMAIFPGSAIFLTVFAYNLVGEALRDAIDPHLMKK